MQEHQYPAGGALVFGGSGGVGRAICLRLAQAGCDVELTYRTNAAAGEQIVASIRALGRRAEAHAVAAGDERRMASLLDDAAARLGGIHTGIIPP